MVFRRSNTRGLHNNYVLGTLRGDWMRHVGAGVTLNKSAEKKPSRIHRSWQGGFEIRSKEMRWATNLEVEAVQEMRWVEARRLAS